MKIHELTRRDLINSVGAAAIGLSAGTLAGCASTAAAAADPVSKAAAASASPSGPQTLTGDWFGQGPALRDAGFDFRLEWRQFYQGMTRGEGDKIWQYGGKLDTQARVDLSKLGFWHGPSVTA